MGVEGGPCKAEDIIIEIYWGNLACHDETLQDMCVHLTADKITDLSPSL